MKFRTLSTLVFATAIATPALAANTATITADSDKGSVSTVSEISSKGSTSSIWMPFDRGESRDR